MPIVIEQLNSQTHWGSIDGTTTLWNFSFSGGYILPTHVKAYYIAADDSRVDIPVDPDLMLAGGPFQLEILPEVPATAKRLVIYRDTPKDLPLVDFSDGARVTEGNLDRIAQQAVFIAAEILDAITAVGMGTSGVSLTDLLNRVAVLEAAPPGGVTSVNGATGAVTGLAPVNSPALTGVPTAPTAAPGTATTQIATTEFVDAAVDAAGGDIATDAIFDAAGDLVQGTGPGAAARLPIGTAHQLPRVNAGATALAHTDDTLSATPAFSATPTLDTTGAEVIYFGALTANVTAFNLSGTRPKVTVVFKQDATGGRTVTAGTSIDFGTDITDLSGIASAANAYTYVGFVYHPTTAKFRVVALSK